MRKWVGIIATGVVLAVLVVMSSCTRSKLGPAPTLAVTQSATAVQTQTSTTGQTVVAAEATATTTGSATPAAGTTPTGAASPSAIPTMTATPAAEATETPTTEVEATATEPVATTPEATATSTSGTEFEYVVQAGDTLWGLALRFDTTVESIKSRNGLVSDIIYNGDKLIIPGAETGEGERITHVVQAGENLFRISLKYGTTVQAIAAANGIINPSYVYVGQELIIVKGGTVPDDGSSTRYHVVQPGETLWSIAMRYGTTPWKIAAANGIANINFIYAGRTLRIP
jgi:LysM repeat protein